MPLSAAREEGDDRVHGGEAFETPLLESEGGNPTHSLAFRRIAQGSNVVEMSIHTQNHADFGAVETYTSADIDEHVDATDVAALQMVCPEQCVVEVGEPIGGSRVDGELVSLAGPRHRFGSDEIESQVMRLPFSGDPTGQPGRPIDALWRCRRRPELEGRSDRFDASLALGFAEPDLGDEGPWIYVVEPEARHSGVHAGICPSRQARSTGHTSARTSVAGAAAACT